MNDHETLVAAWLAGDLTEPEQARLASTLAARPELLQELAMQKSTDAALRVLLDGKAAEQRVIESVTSVLHAKSSEEFRSDFIRTMGKHRLQIGNVRAPDSGFKPARLPRNNLRFAVSWVALTVCLVTAAVVLTLVTLSKRTSAFIASATPGVWLERGSKQIPLTQGMPLRVADRIRTAADQSCDIAYANESTRIELKPHSELQFLQSRNGKRFRLSRGELKASVGKQRTPMVLLTSQAEATVIGTRFSLVAKSHSTWLDVEEGTVQFTRLADARSVSVAAGEFAVAAMGVDLVARRADDQANVRTPIPVRVELFSEYRADDRWKVTREAIEQQDIVTTYHSFKFPPLEGLYSAEVRVRLREVDSLRASRQNFWGFGLGLGRWDPARKALTSIQICHTAHRPNGDSTIGFSADLPPKAGKDEPFPHEANGVFHLKIQTERRDNGHVRLLGKIWRAGEAEPKEWTIQGPRILPDQRFDRVILTTAQAAATFTGLTVNLIE
jgi:hypothetical protein